MIVNGVLKPKLNLQFLLVGRGLPALPNSYAAVPVAPARPHPETGRPTMQPSSPLPWPDCYIYTTRSVDATVSRVYHGPSHTLDPVPALDGDQNQAVFTAYYEDAHTAAVAEATKAAAMGVVVRQAPGTPIDLIFEPEHDDEFLSSDSEISYSGECTGSSPEQSSPASVEDPPTSDSGALAAPLGLSSASHGIQDVPGCIKLHVELRSAIQPIDELASVDEYLSTVDRLYDIEAEWWKRWQTARLADAIAPKATALLRSVSEAGPLDPPHLGELDEDVPYHDDIGPDSDPGEYQPGCSCEVLPRR